MRFKRDVSTDDLNAIAEHYGVPVDRFINEDFSENDRQVTSLTWKKILNLMEIMLPIMCTEEALKDKHFERGYKYTIDIREAIRGTQSLMDSYFRRALEEYEDAFINGGIVESAANMLWITFIQYCMMPDEHMTKVGEAKLQGESLKKDFVKKYVLKDSNPISKENANKKKEYAKESYENRMVLLRILKESENYADLAYYYIALQYIIGFVDNEYSAEMNSTIGIEMMSVLSQIGNQYANNFFLLIELI